MAVTYDYLLKEDGGKIILQDGSGFLTLESFDEGTALTNSTAFTPDQSGYTICDRSGKKVLPGKLVKDPYSGGMVLPQFADEYIPEHTKARERADGSERPEQDINWIVTPITSDDL